jgi:peptide/nickel transport system substrate-binding protein
VDFAAVAAPDVETAKAIKGVTVQESKSITFQAIYPNFTKDYLKDQRVRQALYQALDRDGMVKTLLQGHGEVVVSPIAAPAWAVNPDVPGYAYDPSHAKQLLADAGWDSSRVLNIRLGTGNSVRDAEAPIIEQAFKQIGVQAKINSTDFPTLLKDMQSGNFDLALVGHMSGDDPDYTAIWSATASAPPKGNNFMRYSNPKVDQLLEQGRATLDQAKRKEIYDQYQQLIVQDICMLWLFRANDIFGINQRISGFKPAPGADPLWNIHQWTVA